MRNVLFFAFFCAFLLSAFVMQAQSPLASLVGTVQDSRGGVIAGAQVTVRQPATGAVRSQMTSSNGDYVFVLLPIGKYEVDVAHNGFKSAKVVGIILQVNQTVRQDFKLEVGTVSQSVVVQGGIPLIRTEESSVGTVVGSRDVSTLPLNGRNFEQLATLSPGVVGADPNGINGTQTITGPGTRGELASTRIDGVENSTIQEKDSAAIRPSLDDIAEFRVETGNYDAEFGTSGGVVVNVVTKSGTNQFHGDLYNYLRNDALDAKSRFDTGSKPELRQNQFGGSIGGPVIRNNTFFFFNYEGFRARRATTLRGRVPTEAELNGDYSGEPTIYDPNTTRPDPNHPGNFIRDAFPGNTIPQGRFDPVYSIAAKYWPMPNNPTGGANFNYLRVASNKDDWNQYNIRLDHSFTPNDLVFARYSQNREVLFTPGIVATYGGTTLNSLGVNCAIGYTHIFSPRLLNDATFGCMRWTNISSSQTQNQIGVGSGGVFPIGGFEDVAQQWRQGFPDFTVANMVGIGETGFYNEIDNRFQWSDILSWDTPKHLIKIGGGIAELQGNVGGQDSYSRGGWDFNGLFTSAPLAPGPALGIGLPDFQLGVPDSARVDVHLSPHEWVYFRQLGKSVFINDTWKTLPNLTLNLGFRYEVMPGASELNGQVSTFDAATGTLHYPKQLTGEIDAIGPENIPFKYTLDGPNETHATDYSDFAPRFGFAYRLFGNNETVVRGGYGIYYGLGTTRETNAVGYASPPAEAYRVLTSDPVTPSLMTLSEGFAPTTGPDISNAFNGATLWGADPNWRDPMIQQWNLSIERALPGTMALTTSYVGNHATHLEFIEEDNQPTPLGPGDPKLREPYPVWNRVDIIHPRGYSIYHGLLVQLQKRYSNGLNFIASYAYGKVIGNKSSSWTTGASDGTFAMDTYDIKLERGRLAYDLRQNLLFSGIYTLPFGPGQPFLNRSGWVDKTLLGGWKTAGILTLHTGFPFSVYGGAILNIPNETDPRTDRLGKGGNLPPSQRTIARWFDLGAFAPPAPYTFGNSGRNIIDGPGLRNLDFSILKNFPTFREQHLEFRAEFFNFTNTPSLNRPDNNITDPTAGEISTAGPGREVQVALRYTF